jgi:YMGG-like Gly-zipper
MWKLPVVLVSTAMILGACQTTPQERGALTGGAIGAGTGAVAGAIIGGTPTSAAVGAAIGGTAGAIIGAVANRPGYCYAYDRYGSRVIVECPPGYRG